VTVQGHLDIISDTNGIVRALRDGDFIKTDETTTLGADNGVAIATGLWLLAQNHFPHGPLEILFTADEEGGLNGVSGLDHSLINGKYLLNLDSEKYGHLCVGCAGGHTLRLKLPVQPDIQGLEGSLEYDQAVRISVSKLTGGHSGLEIHHGRANAIKLLSGFLEYVGQEIQYRLVQFKGGSKHNQIPTESSVDLLIHGSRLSHVQTLAAEYFDSCIATYNGTDPEMKMRVEPIETDESPISEQSFRQVIDLVNHLPHGVVVASTEPGVTVDTSSNLALIERDLKPERTGDSVTFTVSQRSMRDEGLAEIYELMKRLSSQYGTQLEHGSAYPAWIPDRGSHVLRVMQQAYNQLHGADPVVFSIHAGLETAHLKRRRPEIDMISYGPTLAGVHTPNERLDVRTVEPFLRLTTETLARLVA